MAAQRTVQWFDVDMPQIIALRRRLYSESDGYRMIGSSVNDAGWLDELPTGGRALVVAEGLLMYLTPAEVSVLLRRLVDRFDTGELQADLLSRWGPRLSKILTSGIIRWGTSDGAEVARWEPRLRLVEDSSVIAGFAQIPLSRLRVLYRMQYAVPAARNYDRLYRYEF
jgi:O-methyltransferase involved in polyketide biosynthesis